MSELVKSETELIHDLIAEEDEELEEVEQAEKDENFREVQTNF